MTIGAAPICMYCRWFNKKDEEGLSCRAFPEGIPEEIYMNEFDHRKPHEGDRGFTFTPRSVKGARYAEELFGA